MFSQTLLFPGTVPGRKSKKRRSRFSMGGLIGGLVAVLTGLAFVWSPFPEIERPESAQNFDLVECQPAPGDRPWWGAPVLESPTNDSAQPDEQIQAAEQAQTPFLVRWTAPLQGAGLSEPCMWGDQVYFALQETEPRRAALIAVHRQTGALLWKNDALPFEEREAPAAKEGSAKLSLQAPTVMPASDGWRIYVPTHSAGRLWLTAVDRKGKTVWIRDVGPSVQEGATQPAILSGNFVLVAGETSSRWSTSAYVAALHRETGELIYRLKHPTARRVASFMVGNTGGRPQVILAGEGGAAAWHVGLGKPLWNCRWKHVAGPLSLAIDERNAYFSSGGESPQTVAVRTNGRGDVSKSHISWWNQRIGSSLGTPVLRGQELIVLNEKGECTGLDRRTGLQQWKVQLEGPFPQGPQPWGEGVLCTNAAGASQFVSSADPLHPKRLQTPTATSEIHHVWLMPEGLLRSEAAGVFSVNLPRLPQVAEEPRDRQLQ